MSFQINLYDRDGRGLRLPDGWWIDLHTDPPALVNGAVRIDLPVSTRNEHPDLQPDVLNHLRRRIEGAQWLT
ncbi:hypothetical protein ACEF39_003705 [Stenotrophomonas indicatrix]